MGLAASQARLLTITARKADCEFMSMSLSHQKLALSRDMEVVSTEYQNALNTTKLVYDYYGSGSSNMDLTYALLMEPSIYNDYFPKLITDSTNRVILNSAYAAAARQAGIPVEGLNGTPSSDVRDLFIDSLKAQGIITPNRADAIKAVPYNNALGLGNGISATVAYDEITYDELLDRLMAYGSSTDSVGLTFGNGKYTMFDGSNDVNLESRRLGIRNADGSYSELKDLTNGKSLTIDMLFGDTEYLLSNLTRGGDQLPAAAMRAMQEEIAGPGGILDWMLDQFSRVLGGITANENALQYAYNCVYDLIVPTNDLENLFNNKDYLKHINDGPSSRADWFLPEKDELLDAMKQAGEFQKTDGNEKYHEDWAKKAYDYFGFYFTGDKDNSWTEGKNSNDRSQISISLNNIAKAFLTSYVQYMEGMDESKYSWKKGKVNDAGNVLYDPKRDKDFRFMVLGEVDVEDGDSYLYASFYDTLFNRICMSGWTENERIDDKDYMAEMLKNGMAFISSISDDGFYYQGNYSTDRSILEVTDTDAVARAQAKYNSEKARIEHKEDVIDLKMRNLDTEISALTTEYDTTKQLVSKTIEKSFKRYDA